MAIMQSNRNKKMGPETCRDGAHSVCDYAITWDTQKVACMVDNKTPGQMGVISQLYSHQHHHTHILAEVFP
jgi:hypothetical protein